MEECLEESNLNNNIQVENDEKEMEILKGHRYV